MALLELKGGLAKRNPPMLRIERITLSLIRPMGWHVSTRLTSSSWGDSVERQRYPEAVEHPAKVGDAVALVFGYQAKHGACSCRRVCRDGSNGILQRIQQRTSRTRLLQERA